MSLQRRQHFAERAKDAQAARELLSLLYAPSPNDLRRRKLREQRQHDRLLARQERHARQTEASSTFELDSDSDSDSDSDPSFLVADDAPHTVDLSASPVHYFDALLAADVPVEQVREGAVSRRYPISSTSDWLAIALYDTLLACSMFLQLDCRAEDEEICREFCLMEDRLQLTAAMKELQRRTVDERQKRDEFEMAHDQRGQSYADDYWDDWQHHVTAQAVLLCEQRGVRAIDCMEGSTVVHLLLTDAEHVDRVLALLNHFLGSLTGPCELFEHSAKCTVCAAAPRHRVVAP